MSQKSGFSRNKSIGRLSRHTISNFIVKRALASAEIFCDLEPRGLILSHGWRLDGITVAPWSAGKSLTWDVTWVCPNALADIGASTSEAGGAACRAKGENTAKYRPQLPNYHFLPQGFAFGSWRKEASALLRAIAAKQVVVNGERRSMEFLRERVSLRNQRGNTMCAPGTVRDIRLLVSNL